MSTAGSRTLLAQAHDIIHGLALASDRNYLLSTEVSGALHCYPGSFVTMSASNTNNGGQL
jgi:hypothetical protein